MLTILTISSLTLQTSHAQADADLKNTVLNIHNQVRVLVNVPVHIWSNDLATDAQKYAGYLTTLGLTLRDKASHAPYDPDNPQGENLWMVPRVFIRMANESSGSLTKKAIITVNRSRILTRLEKRIL